MEVLGNSSLPVLAGDVLTLRGTGLAAAETWALLCQAAQALQDLFLSNGGVVGGGSRAGPVVTPHTLELTPRGRVTLQIASPETARTYLPPEYRPGRIYSDTDSEKMWMYSLGRALLDTTPRAAALTGSVSVSPTSALQSVLAAMTEPDPQRRASLMNLLDVISEYCRTRMLTKPFTLIVIDMYREVVRSPQYAARMRVTCQAKRQSQLCSPYYYYYYHNHSQCGEEQQCENNEQLMSLTASLHYSKHQVKANLHKCKSRNSRSHPNLSCLLPVEPYRIDHRRHHFQSEINIKSNNDVSATVGAQINHARTHSQPIYSQCSNQLGKIQSSRNLAIWNENKPIKIETITPVMNNKSNSSVASDPIYAFPVKPFLSSQDVRVNGLIAKRTQKTLKKNDVYAQPLKKRDIHGVATSAGSHPDMNIETNVITNIRIPPPLSSSTNNVIYQDICFENINHQVNPLYRQYSHPQLSIAHIHSCDGDSDGLKSPSIIKRSQQNLPSSIVMDNAFEAVLPHTAKTNAVYQSHINNGNHNVTQPPPKPPRIGIRNGPRARRGKPVQRASSRLYRAIAGPIRCFNKVQCVGPEFVVRASQPPKLLKVGDTKDGDNDNGAGRIVVILLSGQRIDVICNSHRITAGELFQEIIRAEGLDDNFTLGLAALLAGDFAMLPPETRLSKVSPPGWLTTDKCKGPLCLPTSFMLYLRQRFFLPSLRGIRSWISKHLLYLQIRRCILEQQLICSLNQLVNLTGLALQAEFGNYNVSEHARGNYFLLEHYIPEIFILNSDYRHPHLISNADELREQLHLAHRNRRGLDTNTAEELFITHAQELEDYGLHLYIATTDTRELEKTIERLDKYRLKDSTWARDDAAYPTSDPNPTRDICQFDNIINCPVLTYSKVQSTIPRETYSNIESKENIYAIPKNLPAMVNDGGKKSSVIFHSKRSGSKKTETNIWFGIHGQGIKLYERAGEPRQVTQLIRLQWQDIKTLSYSKNSLIIHTKYNGKRAKLKLNMEHKKSYYAFKLTSLHHQFFLKLRSELTSLQGLTREFGIPLNPATDSPVMVQGCKVDKIKNVIINEQLKGNEIYPTSLEDYQNKENENPIKKEKSTSHAYATVHNDDESVCYTPEDDVLYAQVNARLEPEGASRDTEEENERAQIDIDNIIPSKSQYSHTHFNDNWSNRQSVEVMSDPTSTYDVPKVMSSNNSFDGVNENIKNPEALYAAINKTLTKCVNLPQKSLTKIKTSSLPNYGTSRPSADFRTPSLPRRLGVRMGTRAIYSSSHIPKDSSISDDIELLSLKSETESSIQSTSAQSSDSPLPEAYVLNADIRADDETFCISNDDTMSASLMARLEDLSFAEERILRTIRLERGHGGSIGLQVTEGNDGGVYVQAISVGGSADMAGNVTKGDKIVAINGVSLLNHRYQDALKMLQSSSCQVVELVLSQTTPNRHTKTQSFRSNNVKQNSNIPSTNNSYSTASWRSQKVLDGAPAHSNIVLTGSNERCIQSDYQMNVMVSPNDLNSASVLLNIDDFDNTLPPVPLRRKKRKSIRMSRNHALVHESEDINKVHVINNDCVAIKFNKSEVPPASYLPLEMKMKLPSLNHDEMHGQIDIIEDKERVKHDDVTSYEILPDYSACSIVDEKTEITDDLTIDDCDTSNKYIESTLKIMDNPQIIEPIVINNQTGLDRNFICAISNSCSSTSDRNFNDMDESNYNNSDDNHDAKNKSEHMIDTSNKKNNNNDNNMFEVNFYASRDQACSDDVESTDKGKGRVRKYMKRYESYKDKMMLMYSIKMYRIPVVASGKGNVRASDIEINAKEPHESPEDYIDCTSRKDGCTAIFQRFTTQRKSEKHTAKPGIPCLKKSTHSIQQNNKQKFVKFDNDSAVNSTITKKLKRKAPLIPNTRTFLVPANNETGSQQTMRINNTYSNQIVQSKTLDPNNSAKPGTTQFVRLPIHHNLKPICINHVSYLQSVHR